MSFTYYNPIGEYSSDTSTSYTFLNEIIVVLDEIWIPTKVVNLDTDEIVIAFLRVAAATGEYITSASLPTKINPTDRPVSIYFSSYDSVSGLTIANINYRVGSNTLIRLVAYNTDGTIEWAGGLLSSSGSLNEIKNCLNVNNTLYYTKPFGAVSHPIFGSIDTSTGAITSLTNNTTLSSDYYFQGDMWTDGLGNLYICAENSSYGYKKVFKLSEGFSTPVDFNSLTPILDASTVGANIVTVAYDTTRNNILFQVLGNSLTYHYNVETEELNSRTFFPNQYTALYNCYYNSYTDTVIDRDISNSSYPDAFISAFSANPNLTAISQLRYTDYIENNNLVFLYRTWILNSEKIVGLAYKRNDSYNGIGPPTYENNFGLIFITNDEFTPLTAIEYPEYSPITWTRLVFDSDYVQGIGDPTILEAGPSLEFTNVTSPIYISELSEIWIPLISFPDPIYGGQNTPNRALIGIFDAVTKNFKRFSQGEESVSLEIDIQKPKIVYDKYNQCVWMWDSDTSNPSFYIYKYSLNSVLLDVFDHPAYTYNVNNFYIENWVPKELIPSSLTGDIFIFRFNVELTASGRGPIELLKMNPNTGSVTILHTTTPYNSTTTNFIPSQLILDNYGNLWFSEYQRETVGPGYINRKNVILCLNGITYSITEITNPESNRSTTANILKTYNNKTNKIYVNAPYIHNVPGITYELDVIDKTINTDPIIPYSTTNFIPKFDFYDTKNNVLWFLGTEGTNRFCTTTTPITPFEVTQLGFINNNLNGSLLEPITIPPEWPSEALVNLETDILTSTISEIKPIFDSNNATPLFWFSRIVVDAYAWYEEEVEPYNYYEYYKSYYIYYICQFNTQKRRVQLFITT